MYRIPTLTAAAFLATAASAQILVWDSFTPPIPNSSASNLATSGATSVGNFGLGNPATDDYREVRAFDGTTTPLWNPASGSGIRAYGGFAATAGDVSSDGGTSVSFILRNGTTDAPSTNQVRPQNTVSGKNGATWQGVAFVPLSPSLAVAGLDAIYLRTNGGTANGTYRAVVRSGTSYFVSDASLTAIASNYATNNAGNELFADVTGLAWQPWDFSASSGDNFGVTVSSLGPLPATIDGIGFYFASSTTGTTNIQHNVIAFGYTTVPEPAALASLLALGTLGLAAVRRRR